MSTFHLTRSLFFLSMYFIQGLTFTLQYIPVHYKVYPIFQLMQFSWLLKILVATLVDKIERKLRCLLFWFLGVALSLFLISVWTWDNSSLLLILLIMCNVFMVLEDITVDTYLLELLDIADVGKSCVVQVVGSKLGMIVGTRTLVMMAPVWNLYTICRHICYIQLVAITIIVVTRWFSKDEIETALDAANELESKSQQKQEMSSELLLLRPNERRTKEHLTISRGYSTSLPNVNESGFHFSVFEILFCKEKLVILSFFLLYKMGEIGILTYFPMFLLDAGIKESIVSQWNVLVGTCLYFMGSIAGGWLSQKDTVLNHLWIGLMSRMFLMLTILIIVSFTNQRVNEVDDFWKCAFMIFCLLGMYALSGFLYANVLALIKFIAMETVPASRALYYSILTACDLSSEWAMAFILGPNIDLLGEDFAYPIYFALNLVPLILWHVALCDCLRTADCPPKSGTGTHKIRTSRSSFMRSRLPRSKNGSLKACSRTTMRTSFGNLSRTRRSVISSSDPSVVGE